MVLCAMHYLPGNRRGMAGLRTFRIEGLAEAWSALSSLVRSRRSRLSSCDATAFRVHPKSGDRDIRQGFRANVVWIKGRGERPAPEVHHGTRTRRLESSAAERGFGNGFDGGEDRGFRSFGRVEGLVAGHIACVCRSQGRIQWWCQAPCRQRRAAAQRWGRFRPVLAQERPDVTQTGCEFFGNRVSEGYR